MKETFFFRILSSSCLVWQRTNNEKIEVKDKKVVNLNLKFTYLKFTVGGIANLNWKVV